MEVYANAFHGKTFFLVGRPPGQSLCRGQMPSQNVTSAVRIPTISRRNSSTQPWRIAGVYWTRPPRKRTEFTIGMMAWCLPDGLDAYVKLLKAVDRKGLGVHFGPCNGINWLIRSHLKSKFFCLQSESLTRLCAEYVGHYLLLSDQRMFSTGHPSRFSCWPTCVALRCTGTPEPVNGLRHQLYVWCRRNDQGVAIP